MVFKNKNFKPPHKLYRNILLALTVSIAITIFVLSSILYLTFERVGLNNIHSFIKDGLSQISYSTTFMRDIAKSLSLQIYFNENISKLSYSLLDEREEYLVEVQAAEQLRSYRNTTPFIHSIYVYNSKKDVFYTSLVNLEKVELENKHSFFDQDIIKMMRNIKNYKRLTPIPRKIANPYPKYVEGTFTNVYTFLFYDAPEESDVLDEHIIILNISEEWLRKIIDQMDTEPQSNTFIIDSKGTMVISDEKNTILTNLSGQEYVQQLLSSPSESGYFISEVNDVKSLVTYISSELLDWKFVRVTPYNSIVEKINNMKYRTFQIGLIILAGGLLIAFVISRRLYSPVRNMISKLSSLQTEKTSAHKQNFIRNILQSKTQYSTETIRKTFRDLQVSLTPDEPYFIMLFTIDKFKEFCSNHNSNDRSLIKFAIANIATEVFSASFACESIDINDSHVLILCNVSHPAFSEPSGSLDEMIKKIQSHVLKYYKTSLSVGVSSRSDSLNEASYLYDEALDASNYRLIYGHHCIVHAEKLKGLVEKQYTYPAEKEKLFIDSLLLGKTAEAKSIYLQIVHSTDNYSYNIIKSGLLRLAVDINIVLDIIQRNSGTPMPYNLNSFISELDSMETLEEINQHFCSLFENIVPKLHGGTISRHDKIINKVMETIRANYMDQNLSIDMLAADANMSSMYLGRLFKKMNAKSVAEYMNEVRMEKAKEMLRNTEDSIIEISEKTGFLNSGYFYTLFKKANGITPNQYRHNRRKNNDENK